MTEVHKPDSSKMEYRYLGNSGLKVSVVGFGNGKQFKWWFNKRMH